MSLLTPSPARTMKETFRAIPRRRRIGLHTPPKKVLLPPAWAYADTVGKIWDLEQGAYVDTVGNIWAVELGGYADR